MKIKMQKENEDKTVKKAFQEFIKYCKVKSLSESTISYYKTSYSYFIDFYGEDKSTKGIILCVRIVVVRNKICVIIK
ncbi:MAG: hypothetical protein R6V17_05285 [Halanaerobacter sp.]